MTVSIVYFSQTGNNELLANHLAHRLQCGAVRITEKRRRTPFKTVVELLLSRLPSIEVPDQPFDVYDHLVLVAPVWAGRLASPMSAFIEQKRSEIRDYSFITLCGYERARQGETLQAELSRRVGRPPRASCELYVSDLVPPEHRQRVRYVTPYRVREAELEQYSEHIEGFFHEAGLQDHPPPSEHELRHRAAVMRQAQSVPPSSAHHVPKMAGVEHD